MLMAERWLTYRYSGGRPPASHEELWVDSDLQAQYYTANPWPQQPPFSEIGAYATRLDETEWAILQHELDRWRANPMPSRDEKRSANTGREWLEVRTDTDAITVSWIPPNVPDELQSPKRAIRALISRLRNKPVCTLRAWLEVVTPVQSPIHLKLWFQNRGQRPYHFYDSTQACPQRRARVRLDVHLERGTPVALRAEPTDLICLEPLRLETPQEWHVADDGCVKIAPGHKLAASFIAEEGARPERAGEFIVIDGLVQVVLCDPDASGDDDPHTGWLLLEPLLIADSFGIRT